MRTLNNKANMAKENRGTVMAAPFLRIEDRRSRIEDRRSKIEERWAYGHGSFGVQNDSARSMILFNIAPIRWQIVFRFSNVSGVMYSQSRAWSNHACVSVASARASSILLTNAA